jgi:hypothetical protein
MWFVPVLVAIATTALGVRLCTPWKGMRQVGLLAWAVIAYSAYSWFQVLDSGPTRHVQGVIGSIETREMPGRFGAKVRSTVGVLKVEDETYRFPPGGLAPGDTVCVHLATGRLSKQVYFEEARPGPCSLYQ